MNLQATSISHSSAISRAAEQLGYTLKPEQRRSVEKFVAGNDVFVSLPTGFGKSLCYTLLPPVFDFLRGLESRSFVLVVSPLLALMMDQVAAITALGLTSTLVSDEESTPLALRGKIKNGHFLLVPRRCLFRLSGGACWHLMCTGKI